MTIDNCTESAINLIFATDLDEAFFKKIGKTFSD
jgi:hypothetical protein